MSLSGIAAFLVTGAFVLLAVACDPPGKPRVDENVLAENVTDFTTLFTQNCAGCHGVDGRNGPGRILNDPLYLAIIPRESLRNVLIHGRPGTAMPGWDRIEGGPLTTRQIDILVDGIYRKWSQPAKLPGDHPAYAASASGDKEAGRKLFARFCFPCHGPGAKVGLVTGPSYLSLVSDQMLRTSIIVGRPDLGMPNYRYIKMGGPLNEQNVTDLVAFLASKRLPSMGRGASAPLTQQETK